MDELALLIDLHRDADRQGPGGAAATRRAIALAGLAGIEDPAIADIGCGTGAAALVLAAACGGRVTAVDLLPAFLETLERRAAAAGLAGRIATRAAAMEDLPFADAAFDAVWAEGAIYNIGFERGIAAWRRFLKPGGVLAVSELTWLTAERPAELEAHWQAAYPEVATAGAKIAGLEAAGYAPIGYFVLSDDCWLDNYYRPMEARFDAFLARHDHAEAARAIVANERAEIALYERYSAHYGYGFYVARKV